MGVGRERAAGRGSVGEKYGGAGHDEIGLKGGAAEELGAAGVGLASADEEAEKARLELAQAQRRELEVRIA